MTMQSLSSTSQTKRVLGLFAKIGVIMSLRAMVFTWHNSWFSWCRAHSFHGLELMEHTSLDLGNVKWC